MDIRSQRSGKSWRSLAWCLLLLSVAPALTAGLASREQKFPEVPAKSSAKGLPAAIPAADFSRIVQDVSEDDGYFQSDVFVSNEISYVAIVGKLRELGASGGAYLGVGPEQNFTYIAKIRPQIAFIIDIRRQAVIQHLMYKAIFQLADNRVQFLAYLFSRPLAGKKAPGSHSTARELMAFFNSTPASAQAYTSNLARIAKTIGEDFKFPLSDRDRSSLEYVYGAFRAQGLVVSSRFWPRGGRYPTFRDIVEQTDANGNPGNFLAAEADYAFVRDLQRKNRVIPVVGDFAGSKAIQGVGAYLRDHKYTVTAFYTSNVEQYLFQNGVFSKFAGNVKSLPITPDSLFIRAVMRQPPVVQVPGGRSATLLQKIAVFLKDFDEGIYTDYFRLSNTHFIY